MVGLEQAFNLAAASEDEVPDQVTDGVNMVNFNAGDLAANGVLSQTFPTVIGGICAFLTISSTCPTLLRSTRCGSSPPFRVSPSKIPSASLVRRVTPGWQACWEWRSIPSSFYVSYMLIKASDPTVLYQRVSRFTVPPAQIGLPAPVATPGSELILIEQRDRHDGHNGSDLHFGPDGYLYWVIGDEANTDEDLGNIQRIDQNFFSAMLRIDVDKKPGNLEPNAHPNPSYTGCTTNSIPRDEIPKGSGRYFARYSIPIDNPFVHTSLGGS